MRSWIHSLEFISNPNHTILITISTGLNKDENKNATVKFLIWTNAQERSYNSKTSWWCEESSNQITTEVLETTTHKQTQNKENQNNYSYSKTNKIQLSHLRQWYWIMNSSLHDDHNTLPIVAVMHQSTSWHIHNEPINDVLWLWSQNIISKALQDLTTVYDVNY